MADDRTGDRPPEESDAVRPGARRARHEGHAVSTGAFARLLDLLRPVVVRLNRVARWFLRPLIAWADEDDTWWKPVAGGLLALVVSAIALMALGGQITLMHAPTEAGYGVQGLFSTSHLSEAFEAWKRFWFGFDDIAGAKDLGIASPRGSALTWIAIDLFVFIPGYVFGAGGLLLRVARARRKDRLEKVARAAASLLVLMTLLDIVENLVTGAAVAWIWPRGPGFLSTVVGIATMSKTLVGVPVVLTLLIVGLSTWKRRRRPARITGTLLRGQIGIAVATAVLFSLPIQLPDIFLSLRGWQIFWLGVSGMIAAVATWAIARWVVVSREERPDAAGANRVEAVVWGAAAVLVLFVIVNWVTDGNPKGPAIPLAIAAIVFVVGRVLRAPPSRQQVDDLGGPGVFVPQVLATVGGTFAAGAVLKAMTLLAVAKNQLLLIPVFVAVALLAIAAVGGVTFLLEHRVSGRRASLRNWVQEPVTTKALLRAEGKSGTDRSRSLARIVAAAGVVTLLTVWWLLFERVAGPQAIGAAAAVFVFVGAANLVAGGTALAADAWQRYKGLPRALAVVGFRRIPVFTLLLVWGLVAAKCDDGRHFDVRKLKGGKQYQGVTLAPAFTRWLAGVEPEEGDGRRAIPLAIVATSGGGIRSAYWTSLALDCVFAGRAAPGWEDDNPCDSGSAGSPAPEDIFLASGISGGSLGLVSWDASRDAGAGPGWVDEKLGEDFVAPTVAWGLFVEVPRSFLHFEADDRAEVLEESWERPWKLPGGNEMKRGFLGSQQETYDAAQPLAEGSEQSPDRSPLLLLNGSSVFDGCALNVSLLDIGSTVDQVAGKGPAGLPLADCLASTRYADPGPDEPPGPLPATADLVDYLECGDMHDVRRSTAALLSARFPYVSSAGRLAACEAESSTKFILDGGIVDTSAAEAAVAVYMGLEPLIDEYNAQSEESCVVPYFVQIDNDYEKDSSPRQKVAPPNQLLAPLQGLSATTGLSSRAARARALAAQLFTSPYVTAPAGTAPVTEARYTRIVPRQHPGVEAPLGWTLSKPSRDDLERQLYVSNEDPIEDLREWFERPPACEPLPDVPAE